MMMRERSGLLLLVALFLTAMGAVGCQTLREVAQLRKVAFQIDRVSNAELSGIDLREVRSYQDLGGVQLARLASNVSNGRLPLSFTLHLEGTNPEDNSVNARLTEMDWTLLLQDKETISGTTDREHVLSPGTPTDIPLELSVNLLDFFDENLQGLVELAAAFGEEAPPATVELRMRPTIRTSLGPIRYPEPITVTRRSVGGDNSSS
ncbi:MAG: hypothetical protein R6T83_02380 [Salinibacter sp.]